MLLKFSPVSQNGQGQPARLSLDRKGDVLTVNGEVFDFSPLPEGATLPALAIDCQYFVGPVSRVQGELQMTLLLPYGFPFTDAQAHPVDLDVSHDGTVDLPAWPESALKSQESTDDQN